MRLTVLFLALISCCLTGQERVESWRPDVRFMAQELPRLHKDPFTVMDEASWRAQVKKFEASLDEVDGVVGFEIGLMKLVAMLGDSHTNVMTQTVFSDDLLPLAMHWFSDGLYVLKAPRAHQDMLGSRVVTIGGVSLEDAIRRLGTVRVFDNRSSVLAQAPSLLRAARLLDALGVAVEENSVTFELEKRGERSRHTVKVGGFGPFPAHRRPKKGHVTARRADRWHHHQFIKDSGVLYVQYNRCATGTQHDLGKFIKTLTNLCESGDVTAIVFEVQYNGGGNSMLGDRMFARLSRHPPMRQVKNVFCVIGRRTFSSAILNAETLKRRYGAVLLGEPTGGSPNHFGEVRSFQLPVSKLQVRYSTKRFTRGPPGARTVKPDHMVSQSYADYVTGRDSIMDKVRMLVR